MPLNESIAKNQRQWPHRNIELQMIETERRRKESQKTSDDEYYDTKPRPESAGSYQRRLDVLRTAIRAASRIDSDYQDDGWY
jgi:hypothetical protein